MSRVQTIYKLTAVRSTEGIEQFVCGMAFFLTFMMVGYTLLEYWFRGPADRSY